MTKPNPKPWALPPLIVLLVASALVALPDAAGQQSAVSYVQVLCTRSDQQMDHQFLSPGETVAYNASARTMDGFGFDSFSVQMNSSNSAFLRQLTTDLYIESYDYFGGLGAWTGSLNFTVTNPTVETQELFLKIVRNYAQTTYAVDNVVGTEHTIGFSTVPEADRVFVKWNFFGALTHAAVNGSEVDFNNALRSPDAVRVEYLPNYLSFQVPPRRIQNTSFQVKVEERAYSSPTGYCYISALLVQHMDVALGPQQTYLFDLPVVNGWSYLAGAAYTNLTASAYPQPYPFQLINMSIWDPTQTPMLATALDTTFGVRNLSNQNWTLGFDLLYYYWQNRTALTFAHRILGSTLQAIAHEVSANVSDANVGADLGLSGQFLRFQLPGLTVSFEAPNPVGKYPQSYIPLRQGAYTLITSESRITAQVTRQTDDLQLSATLHFNVTYAGDSYADAAIAVTQTGTFTSRTYTATTDQNGQATITIHSNGPEQTQLSITVTKDQDNYSEHTISYFVGASWIAAIVVLIIAAVFVVVLLWRHRKRGTNLPRIRRLGRFPKTFKNQQKNKIARLEASFSKGSCFSK